VHNHHQARQTNNVDRGYTYCVYTPVLIREASVSGESSPIIITGDGRIDSTSMALLVESKELPGLILYLGIVKSSSLRATCFASA
jgi:hypothetical protein